MANTEGMSDEVMRDLLSCEEDDMMGGGGVRPASTSALQQRMEMPMGERPAATVIRRSRRRTQPTKQEEEKAPDEEAVRPVVGEIVERPFGGVENQLRPVSNRPKSKFAQQRQNGQPAGFPSLNVPLGRLAKNKGGSTSTSSKSSIGSTPTSTNPGQRDADTMLAQMSSDEIRENVDELKSALSPELVEFLRKRGEAKATKAQAGESQTVTAPTTTPQKKIVPNDLQEKERLAKVMSSIQTYNDLDQAVEKEVGTTMDSGLADQPEWTQACSLLRSTAPRQTLWAARIICEHLEHDIEAGRVYSIGEANASEWPYPVLLPVSLRCLLDAPAAHSNGLLLHTYVLRSLYVLIRLRAPAGHAMDVTNTSLSMRAMHETLFLDDAVPTPPFGSLYPAMATTPMNVDGQTVAYSTSSSSTSAQTDGKNFIKDPMWTLLSRMKIVPRLAQFLASPHAIPAEAFVAISGIVTMLSLRSPGAASAISQHATLLKNLLNPTVMPASAENAESFYLKPTVMRPVMVMLNAMTQQSRVVAAKIPHEDILLPLLGINVDADEELIGIQTLGLTLWRKLLRYGVGLAGVPTLSSLFVMNRTNTSSLLAMQYCSLFSAFLDCVKTFEDKAITRTGLGASIQQVDQVVLSEALTWLLPLVVECVKALNTDISADDATSLSYQASLLRLVNSFVGASVQVGKLGEVANVCIPCMFQVSMMAEDAKMQIIFDKVPIQNPIVDPAVEASACCFMSELFSFISTVSGLEVFASNDERISILCSKFSVITQRWLAGGETSDRHTSSPACPTRTRWISQCHFSVAKFLMKTAAPAENSARLRSLIIMLIGRLRLGDEAMAAILFSNHSIFSGRSYPEFSPVSSMFMRELCSNEIARKQLDHAFKLQRGFGITESGWGPFGLESLLSEGDKGPVNVTSSLLPLGTTWMWQVLSGSLGATSNEAISDVSEILGCALSVLEEMCEQNERGSRLDGVPPGSKVYFLLNIFLYPEIIVGNDVIRVRASTLLDKLCLQVGDSFGSEFVAACYTHAQSRAGKTDDAGQLSLDHVLSLVSFQPTNAPSKALRTIKDFVADLTTAFLEYGAQYEECLVAVRSLLRPQVPSILRCELIERLRAVLHLLTLESEQSDERALMRSMESFVHDGLPSSVGEQDSPAVLDLLVNIFRQHEGGVTGFFFVFGVVTLARALIARLSAGRSAMERRMLAIPSSMAATVLATATEVLNAPVFDKSLLIQAAMRSKPEHHESLQMDKTTLGAWFEVHGNKK